MVRGGAGKFRRDVLEAIKARGVPMAQVARDLGESPMHLYHLIRGFRPHYRLRRKLARCLDIPLSAKDSEPSAEWQKWHPEGR